MNEAMIIDAHTHIHTNDKGEWETNRLLSSMDEAGIDMSLVISNHVTNAPMEKMLELVKDQPRFKLIGNVEFTTLNEEQIERLKTLLKNKEILGVKLFPGYEDFYPYDEKLNPIFEYCQANNHPIVIHTGPPLATMPGLLIQAHPIHIDRIANRYPNLKIIIAHMGNPWFADTAAVMWRNKNVYTDVSGYFEEYVPISKQQGAYFLRQMKEFHDLLNDFKRVIFGTDWPLYSQKEYLDLVKQIELTDEEKEKVLWKTANDVYNLGR